MAFAPGLRDSLQIRERQLSSEFEEGYSLEKVLDGHLLTVERMAKAELITSVLLLSPDGKRLFHGAGPTLPQSYRAAIDGSEIGPSAGSCGTAAFMGQPVYVADIATDPLWKDYRDLALSHGLRSCWSTPIRDPTGSLIGTFAIYHPTAGGPSKDEIEAIDMITHHVAAAIVWGRGAQDLAGPSLRRIRDTRLEAVIGGNDCSDSSHRSLDRLLLQIEKLETIAAELDGRADTAQSEEERVAMRAVADDCRQLTTAIRLQIEHNFAIQ